MKAVIVGGGVLGLLSALELQRAGLKVTVVDQGKVGGESSWAGGGIVSPLYPWRYPPAVTALAVQAQELYPVLVEELRAGSGTDPELTECGMLMLEPEDVRDALVWAKSYRRKVSVLNGQSLSAMGSGLARFEHAVWMPGVANIRNPRLLQALRKVLERQGGEIIEHAPVMEWRRDAQTCSGIVAGSGRIFEADYYICAAGAWSAEMAGLTGVKLPVRPIRGQMIQYFAPQVELSCILLHRGHYVIPRRDGHILCGSTLEDCGFDKAVTNEAGTMLQNVAHSLVPALSTEQPVRQWAGLRPSSPNGIPFIGRHPELDNVWFNTGHYRNGLVLAPASAKLLADLVLGRVPSVDPLPYGIL